MVDRQNTSWSDRHHFFWAAARAMKDILVERARYDSAVKRGGRHSRVALDDGLVAEMDPPDLIDLTDALERLAAIHPDAAQILELKFFAGLNREEIGEMMELSPAAVWRKWNFARAWLLNELDGRSPDK